MIEAMRRLPDWYGYLLIAFALGLLVLVAILASRISGRGNGD